MLLNRVVIMSYGGSKTMSIGVEGNSVIATRYYIGLRMCE